jgi:hypothetical protein
MIKFDNTTVMNFEGALRGMRNPLESWDKSDSKYCRDITCEKCATMRGTKVEDEPECPMQGIDEEIIIGENDRKLALNLTRAGSDHGKFMRQIFVSVDITAPLYWWKEFDTYKVGTVANSTSTMHKLGSRPLTPNDFSWDNEDGEEWHCTYRQNMLSDLNRLIENWKEARAELEGIPEGMTGTRQIVSKRVKNLWRRMIQDLPSSFNQTRTVTLNYQVLRTIYHSDRRNHKQVEWRVGFMDWIKSLPYSELITTPDYNKKADKLLQVLLEVKDKLHSDPYVKPSSCDDIIKLIDKVLEE